MHNGRHPPRPHHIGGEIGGGGMRRGGWSPSTLKGGGGAESPSFFKCVYFFSMPYMIKRSPIATVRRPQKHFLRVKNSWGNMPPDPPT